MSQHPAHGSTLPIALRRPQLVSLNDPIYEPSIWGNSRLTFICFSDRLNLTDVLDHELKAGPLKISLADINWPSSIQKQIDRINGFLLAIFILYCLAIGFSGLAMLGSAGALFTGLTRLAIFANFTFAALAALVLLIASVIVIVAARQGQEMITDVGEAVGVSAIAGEKFIILSWVAFAVMAAATIYWLAQFWLERRARKRVFTEKPGKIRA
jgi:hypothetical protein